MARFVASDVMNSGANEAGAIAILGAGETGQNRLINVQNGEFLPSFPTPLGPSNGGKLDRAPK